MADHKKRSERVIPFVSDEEVVVIRSEGNSPMLAKIMDLSESGALVYLLGDGDLSQGEGDTSGLAVYHQGKIFEIPAMIARKDSRLVAFQFKNPPEEVMRDIQVKLIRMEIDWMRLSRRS